MKRKNAFIFCSTLLTGPAAFAAAYRGDDSESSDVVPPAANRGDDGVIISRSQRRYLRREQEPPPDSTVSISISIPTTTRGCSRDQRRCPDGSKVHRDSSNNCEFFDCPEPVRGTRLCNDDAIRCPDGTWVGRNVLNNCNYFSCNRDDMDPSILLGGIPGGGGLGKLDLQEEDGTTTSSPSSSIAPSSAPTTCEDEDGSNSTVLFQLDLFTDDFGSDTTWRLINACSYKTILSSSTTRSGSGSAASTSSSRSQSNSNSISRHGYYYHYSSNTHYQETKCIDSQLRYRFIIEDDHNDGICCLHGQGNYTIYFNGTLIQTGGDFDDVETVVFGGNDDDGC